MLVKDALPIVGGLSSPSKMPCPSYSIPALRCAVGSILRRTPGSTCESCYAMKGFYAMSGTEAAMHRRFATLGRASGAGWALWIRAWDAILARRSIFRWHDSGDIQNLAHLAAIVRVAQRNPHCAFWIPTREYALIRRYTRSRAFPPNLTVRLSAPLVDRPAPDIAGLPTSTVHTDAPIGTECLAYTRHGHCGPCRACWDPEVTNVSYRIH